MKNSLPSIDASKLMQKLHVHDDIMLIDVREQWEHDAYNIGGMLIPLNSIFENVDLVRRDKMVVLYCAKGIRSQIAIQRLQQRYQFDNLVNLFGGMEAWKREVNSNTSHTYNH